MDPDGRLSVGRFARRCGLTPKALRHYDRIALFRPAFVDASGYRWYEPDQLGAPRLIARLRAVDVPLDEIRACLTGSGSPPGADPARVRATLLAHERRLEDRLSRVRGDLHEIAHLLSDRTGATEGDPAMTGEPPTLDHRRLGGALFNEVWELMEKEDRTRDDDDRMLHAAHVSRYHWGQVGTPAHLARGEWQCSRVYAVLRRPEPCLHHARRVLDLCTENDIGDWDLAFAHEALARGHAIAGDDASARLEAERALAIDIADDEDRSLVLADLETVPGLERFW